MLPKRKPSRHIEKHAKVSAVVSMKTVSTVEGERGMRDVVVSYSIKYSIHRVLTTRYLPPTLIPLFRVLNIEKMFFFLI